MKCIDLTGQKFGRLTVIERVENYVSSNGQQKAQWLCKCECGNITVVRGASLIAENTTSCGCLGKEHRAASLTTHGHHNDRLYCTWQNMKDRCYNSHSDSYKDYGNRGITVCAEWLHDFEAFYKWAMANGYREDLTLDRIDVNGNYEPSNCRWATPKEQANNTRRNRLITYNGKTLTLAQWADETKIRYATLYMRIYKLRWDIERAITTK